GCGASHPDRPPPLPRGAAAGQCHTGVSGQRGLPLTVEAELEGGGRSSTTSASHSLEVLGSDGRFSWSSTLNLPADQWKKVDSVTCEASLGGRELCHSKPGPSQLLSLEVQHTSCLETVLLLSSTS
ncbi:Ig lambda-3 chain C region, partial [Takifugu flavidus]